jgi:hypothetical protein
MADEGEIPITQESVDSFVEKLHGWATDLPVEEKAVLHSLLARAGLQDDEDEPEVEGYMMGGLSFTPQILSKAVLGTSDDGTVDSWPKGGSWIKLWGQTIPK